MYNLYAPMWDADDTLRKLLKEVLGYRDDEITVLESQRFCRNIVIDVTLEQGQEISKIFNDNEFSLYLNDGIGVEDVIFWKKDLGIDWDDEPPKDHYCDEPLVSREHLIDPSTPKPVRPATFQTSAPIVTCPYCHSTNTRKLSGFSKLGMLSWGAAPREWHCNRCNSDF